MEHVLVAFGVWLIWNAIQYWLTTPEWFPWTIVVLLSFGGELLVNPSTWWLGLGVAGMAALIMKVYDLLLVTADQVRTQVVRNASRGRVR